MGDFCKYSDIITNEEKLIFKLRKLYSEHNYTKFKMNKFEEYDFYAKNKDFLTSDSIITFNDTNGKLLALKPDVTLSILKNIQSDNVSKLYYDESVYRVSTKSHTYRESMQIGLECFGDFDKFTVAETVKLAADSLSLIDENYLLDISHLGVIYTILDYVGIEKENYKSALQFFSQKNFHSMTAFCDSLGIDSSKAELVVKLMSVYGRIDEVVPTLEEIFSVVGHCDSFNEFKSLLDIVDNSIKDKVFIDFSVTNYSEYYNGVVFNGYVDNVPESVLFGGEYSKLAQKINGSSNAIGFAIYLDMLGE